MKKVYFALVCFFVDVSEMILGEDGKNLTIENDRKEGLRFY